MVIAMVTVTRQFEAALGIVGELRAAGFEAYFAGGCVRDLMLGREPVDYDVATSATPEVVLEMFPRTFAVGAHFGVVLVATCGGADGACAPGEEAAGYTLTEVATFRSDGAYSDGRHPDAVRYTTSAEEDVRRRDFTINGLLLDPEGLIPQGLKPGSPTGVDVRAGARTLQSEERASGAERAAIERQIPCALPGTSGAKAPIDVAGPMRGLKPPPPSVSRFSAACEPSAADRRTSRDAGPSASLRCAQDDSLISRVEASGNAGPSTSLRSAQDDSSLVVDAKLRAAVIDFVGGVADLEA